MIAIDYMASRFGLLGYQPPILNELLKYTTQLVNTFFCAACPRYSGGRQMNVYAPFEPYGIGASVKETR